ncbi:MAG: hypothetical protein Q9222_006397 [Ikaeria aurantiellina]
MHRVKQWAHSTARADNHNALTQSTSAVQSSPAAPATERSRPQGTSEKDKETHKVPVWRRFYDTVKKICLSSWVNVLLVFVPVGIAVNFAGVNPTIIFAMNAIAIIPLAGMLAYATESVAHRLGDTLGALLNVSFGNAVELIILIALVKNEIRIVQASLLGSILANLLLILGMSFLIGGLQYQEQIYNIDEESHPGILRRMHSSSASSVTSSSTDGSAGSRRKVRAKIRAKLGRKRKVKLEPDPEAIDEDPGPLPMLARGKEKATTGDLPLTQLPNTKDHAATPNVRPSGPLRLASFAVLAPPVFRNASESLLSHSSAMHSSPPSVQRVQSGPNPRRLPIHRETTDFKPVTESDATSEPPLSKTASVLLLLASTGLVALCAEFMVDSINALVVNTPLSEAFVGLIILPIVGNAAEHVTAVTVAAKNKMDLAIGVAVGSSIQIATFITPIVVIIGWIMNKDMPLYFTLFETVTLFVATFVVNFLVLDGRSNYLEGSLLCSSYIIIAQQEKHRRKNNLSASVDFGLLKRQYESDVHHNAKDAKTRWQRFHQEVDRLNNSAGPCVLYKVLYMGRHGQGDHNVAERRYGRKEWDAYWAAQEGDSTATWVDARLTETGVQQALAVNAFWKHQITTSKTPVPERYYVSPLYRCLETANHTFSDLELPPDKPYAPIVKELLREVNGVHTCDRRSSRSSLAVAFPNFSFDSEVTEDDESWSPIVRESDEDIDQRMQQLLDDIFQNDSSTFVSFTSHSGAIRSLLRVLGHREFRLVTGAVIPVLVRAERIRQA